MTINSKGQFCKGSIPWNKGKYGYMGANRTSFTKDSIKRSIGAIQMGKDQLVCVSKEVRPTRSKNGKIYMHHKRVSYAKMLMEKELGRPLATNEIVYHIDGDIKNNNLDNLEVISRAELLKRNQRRK